MLIAWLTIMHYGTTAYYVMYSSYPKQSPRKTEKELWTRSVLSSIQLFAFSIDSNAVDGWKAHAQLVNTKVSDQLHYSAVCAGIWTIFFVVLLLFKSLWLWIIRHLFSQWIRRDLYIFWGVNRRSIQLAHEINEWRNTIFVVQPNEKDSNTIEGLEQILNKSQYRNEIRQQIGSYKASILIATKPITETTSLSYWKTWRNVGLSLMCRYIMRTTRNVHIFLLGDNESQNIYDSLRLADLSLWNTCVRNHEDVTIHCLARRGNANRLIEDVTANSVIEIIDSSHLAIELLKKDSKNHPVQFVEQSKDNPGTVSSSFNCLIVGFSECGQDALRFLYEFSAFVDAESKTKEDIRSPFYCDVVDKQLPPSAARWMNHAQDMFYNNKMRGEKRITFHEKNYGSKEFYNDVLKVIIKKLNYVVIAVGDDKVGITLAADIMRYAIKMGRLTKKMNYYLNIDKFRIYVRSYNPDMYEYLKTIASYYNEGGEYISIFGAEHELFSYNMLVDDSLKTQAQEYQFNYHWMAAKQFEWENKPKETKEKDWSVRRKEALKSGMMSKIQDLRRQESQDYANALHLETKKILKLYGASPLRLAQTEHLRWWAAHEIMGYKYDAKKDITLYNHDCMKPFSELTDTARKYDFLTFNQLYKAEDFDKIMNDALKIFVPERK